MRYPIFTVACALLVAWPAVAQNEIYKSTDAEGNPVFSGVPTNDSEPVELEPTNTADPVEVRPSAERGDTAAPASEPSPEEYPEDYDGTTIIGGDDDLRDDLYEQRRQEELRERVGNRSPRPKPTPLPQPVRPGAGGVRR